MDFFRLLQHRLPPTAFDAVRLTNGLILLVVLAAPLERLFAARPHKFFRREFWTDIAYYYLSSLLPNKVLALPVGALVLLLHYARPAALDAWTAALPLPVRFAAAMLVAEIGFYWGHRWMHSVAFLWRFHAVHHSAPEMDWLVNTRAHPVDLLFTRFCGYAPLYALGLAQPASNRLDWVPLAIALLGSTWGYFIHANLRWRFGWLENVIATPAFHHWHHSNAGPGPLHNNYAPTWPWIDRIFGTWRLDPIKFPDAYGADDPVGNNLAEQLLRPFLPPQR